MLSISSLLLSSESSSVSSPKLNSSLLKAKHALFALGVVLVFIKAPDLLLKPRLWAEEASLYLQYAYLSSFWEALTYAPQNVGGYFSLSANFPAALSAHVFGIESANWVATYFTFSWVLVGLYLIIYPPSLILDSWWKRALVVVLYLFGPLNKQEAWMNSINLMSHLGIFSLFIFVQDTEKQSLTSSLLSIWTLIWAGLTGVYTIFLAPLFFFRAIQLKNTTAFSYAGVVILAALFQVFVFASLYLSSSIAGNKLKGGDFRTAITSTVAYHVVDPLIGAKKTDQFLKGIEARKTLVKDSPEPPSAYGLSILSLVFVSVVLLGLLFNFSQLKWWLLGAFLSVSILSSAGAMNHIAGGRYAMVPGWSLLLFFLSGLRPSSEVITSFFTFSFRYLRTGVVTLALLGSVYFGIQDQKRFRYFEYSPTAPSWTEQMAIWKDVPNHEIMVWPHPRWTFMMPSREALNEGTLRLEALWSGDSVDIESPIKTRLFYHKPEEDCGLKGSKLVLTSGEGEAVAINACESGYLDLKLENLSDSLKMSLVLEDGKQGDLILNRDLLGDFSYKTDKPSWIEVFARQ